MSNPFIFDRANLRRHRDRAAMHVGDHFLFNHIAELICDRLTDFKRPFPLMLDLGAHSGLIADRILGRGGVQVVVQTDMSTAMLEETSGPRVACDEEFLPFAENVFDVVVSGGSLQWVNDLPGTLMQIKRILKPDGLFLAIFPGGESLKELRQSLEAAEQHLTGGISPRVSPFIDVRDAGSLLTRAGFDMPVTDSEKLTVYYQNALTLYSDLRDLGETNVLFSRTKHFTRRRILFEAADYYEREFKRDKGIPVTFELVAMTGWKA